MTHYLLVLLLLYSTLTCGQGNFDSSQVDKSLRGNNQPLRQYPLNDLGISQTIKAIDKNLNDVIRLHINYEPLKFTIVESSPILVRQLSNRQEAVKAILSEKEAFANFQSWWEKCEYDTIKFLSNMHIKDEYDLNYPDFNYPKYLFAYPVDSLYHIETANLIFFSKSLENKLSMVVKNTPQRQRKKLFNYLEKTYDYFSAEDKKFEAKAIAIRTITFGSNSIVYAGVDIYGSHYLLSFDSSSSWKLKSSEKLWMY